MGMFCAECGSALEEGALFCAECGTPVEMIDEESAQGDWVAAPTANAPVDGMTPPAPAPFILNREVRKHFVQGGAALGGHEFTLVSRGLFSLDRQSRSSAVDEELGDRLTRERRVSSKLPSWDPVPPDTGFMVDRHAAGETNGIR